MRDWLQYDKGAIFRDRTRGGLLSQFLKEYSAEFGVNTTPGCRRCLETYYNNYLKTRIMADEKPKCDYELHKKYNGIQLGTNGDPIRNGEMTNEIAKKLLEKHPHGAKLFSKMPEPPKDEELTLKELKAKYPEIKAKKKADFIKAIHELS